MYLSTEGVLTKKPIIEDVLKFNLTLSDRSIPYRRDLGIVKSPSGASDIIMSSNIKGSITSAVSRASENLSITNLDLQTSKVYLVNTVDKTSLEVDYAD